MVAFPTAVYILCFATAGACAFLLARNYQRTGVRLLLWSAICFALLAANNFLVVLDLVILPAWNLSVARLCLSLAAVVVLLFGFIWDQED
jgi:hypothetical protein